MSNIPNSAMPHAGAPTPNAEDADRNEASGTTSLKDRAASLAETARANPMAAAAAGAAVVAGIAAAAAIPLMRGRSSSGGKSKSSTSKKS